MQQIFINGEHEYDFVREGEVYSLYYSNSSVWSHPLTLAMSIKDTGDGFKILSLRQKNFIDYPEGEKLKILLSFLYPANKYKFEIVEKLTELL